MIGKSCGPALKMLVEPCLQVKRCAGCPGHGLVVGMHQQGKAPCAFLIVGHRSYLLFMISLALTFALVHVTLVSSQAVQQCTRKSSPARSLKHLSCTCHLLQCKEYPCNLTRISIQWFTAKLTNGAFQMESRLIVVTDAGGVPERGVLSLLSYHRI